MIGRSSRRHLAWAGSLLLLALVTPGSARELECGEQPADVSRIAVAGGSLVEILYALEEEARIIAADRTATYPASARDLPQIGYVRALSAEGLLSLQPTFLLGEHDMGPPEVVAQLARLDIDMLRVPEVFSVDGIRAKIRCVAQAVGAPSRGEALAQSLLSGLAPDALRSFRNRPDRDTAPAGVVLLGLRSGAPIAAGTDTSGNGLLSMAGVRNLMDFEGWKPVSTEAMAAARPDFIVIPERGLAMAGGLAALLDHPALRLTPAARHGRVISMDGMAMLGFGLRTVDAARTLAQQLDDASTGTEENRAP